MLAFDQDTWTTEQEIPTQLRRQAGADELDRDRLSRAAALDPEEDDEDLEDDDLDLDEDDDLDLDEEDDFEDDVVPGYNEDVEEDDDDLDDPIRATIDDDDEDFVDASTDPDEIPGREEAADEDLGAPAEQDIRTPQEGNDASYSEQTDVTPPRTHEFPSEGSPKTDFTSRNLGRTTGRMVGHEPGTEGI